jgi:uncharacterized membrane protein
VKLAAGVLAILVLPLIVYAIDPGGRSTLHLVVIGLYLALGLALLLLSSTFPRARRPDRSIDERALDRRLVIAALLAAAVIGNFALLLTKGLTPIICGFAIVWSLVWLLPFTRRISVTTQVLINRDVKTVFGFMSDMRNEPQFMPEIVSVEKITEGDIGPGTQFRTTVRMNETSTFEGVEEIVDMEWGHRITDRLASGTRPNYGVMTFDAVGAATKLSYQFVSEVSYASALVGQGVFRWAMTGEMRRRRMQAWARLKQLLESRPAS